MSQPEHAAIERAAKHLKQNGCVAMPTETVYGLAARIDSKAGIAAIFNLKQRPSFDPLIVHVASLEQIKTVASDWPSTAASLVSVFWPGPLTLVVKKRSDLNPMITAGLETVGIRMPRHKLALELIEAAGSPLAAPSANRFGRTSPTSADHVRHEFREKIESGEILLIDGGDCAVGVESTVCLIDAHSVTILRPGGVTNEQIRSHFANRPEFSNVKVQSAENNQASPGHTEHHYETAKPLIVSWTSESINATAIYDVEKRKITGSKILQLKLPADPVIAARMLYATLRSGDSRVGYEALFIHRDLTVKENRGGLWRAIDDRLRRAARLQLGNVTKDHV